MVPDAINLASVRNALVVKLRHHGDVLLTSPVFQVLRTEERLIASGTMARPL